jgi:beta-lactamase class A
MNSAACALRLQLAARLLIVVTSCTTAAPATRMVHIDHDTQPSPALQSQLVEIDRDIRARHDLGVEPAAGLVDLRTGEVAMLHPDRIDYAASVPKIGILYAWFALHPEAHRGIDEVTRRELGLMIKQSSNEMAAKYSRLLGLRELQSVLNEAGFYDASRGGGLWVGKHYGPNSERIGDPVADHSHAATVRQLLRFYTLLEARALLSPEASDAMRDIFESPAIPHDEVKFMKGLAGRDVDVIRKLGSWQEWQHDTAVVMGDGRHYILVAMTKHPRGDAYLESLAAAIDDLMIARARRPITSTPP